RHFQELADFGMPEAQARLAKQYMWGKGVPKDRERALSLLVAAEAAQRGNQYAQDIARVEVMVATESLYGRSGAYSRDEALHLIRHRADAGDAEAQFELARAYEKGIGVSQNGALASKYYQKATDQGHAKAAYY